MTLKLYHKIVIVAVIIIIGIAVAYSSIGSSSNALNLTSYGRVPVSAYVLGRLAVPQNVSNAVGAGLGKQLTPVNGTPLVFNGKPEVLYIGAEYCPYCAAERWPLIVALMRFGSFSGLQYMTSSPSDYSPNTPTFTFVNSTYTSNYISFVSIETMDNKLVNGNYGQLQTLNSSEAAIDSQYNPQGYIPFIDFGNSKIDIGASYDPLPVLGGRSWNSISENLSAPSSLQALSIVGNANIFTAEICSIDNNTPQSVCGQQYVKKIENGMA